MIPGSLDSGDDLGFLAALRAWWRAGTCVLWRSRRKIALVAQGFCLAAALPPAAGIWS